MTASDGARPAKTGAPKRVVKVTASMIEAAGAQVAISKDLGLPVSKVVEKIAAVQ